MGGGKGTEINGAGEATGIYYENLNKGDLVTIRRHYGFDTPIALDSPSELPTGDGRGVAFSPDGSYLAVAHSSSPYITIYKVNRDTNTFTKLSNPSTLPTGTGRGVVYDNFNAYLVVAHVSSPYIIIYKGDLLGDYIYKYNDFKTFYYRNLIALGYVKESGEAETEHKIVTLITR